MGLSAESKEFLLLLCSARTEETEDKVMEKLYKEVEKVYEKIPKYDVVIVLGDFNA